MKDFRLRDWIYLLVVLVLFSTVAAQCNAAKPSPDRVLASVRIGQRGGCAGTIIKIHGDHAWGISAAHCASANRQFTFWTVTGTSGLARWVAIDRKNDLALFICWSEDVLEAAKVCRDALPDWSMAIEAIGFPGGSGPKWKRLSYTGGNNIRASNGKFYRASFNYAGGPFGSGDSGGGVFYDGDWLVGVMTHGGNRIHAATHRQIIRFLDENRIRMKWVDPFRDCWGKGKKRPGWLRPNIPINPNPDPRLKALQEEVDRLKTALEAEREKAGISASLATALMLELEKALAKQKQTAREKVKVSKPLDTVNRPDENKTNWGLLAVLILVGGGVLLFTKPN